MKAKQLVMSVAVLMTTFALFSCQSQEEKTETESTQGNEQQETMESERDQQQKTGLQQAYNAYLDLKDALVASDAEKTKEAAEELSKKLDQAEVENAESMKTTASEIAASDDIEAQRTKFSTLSEAFIEVAKNNPEALDEAYVQHCPMAFNNEGGNWLSDEKEIRNPYFGDRMLKCGKVTETIAGE